MFIYFFVVHRLSNQSICVAHRNIKKITMKESKTLNVSYETMLELLVRYYEHPSVRKDFLIFYKNIINGLPVFFIFIIIIFFGFFGTGNTGAK